MKKLTFSVITFLLITLFALFIRTFNLQNIPSGLHHDEAWFAYNAFLLIKQGTNLYGEFLPLTVDMWGEHVSAAHSYFAAPFVLLFGLSTTGFRLTTVTFSILTLLAAAFFLYRVTRRNLIVLIFSLLFALSPWNIIMARASSTVIIDSFFLVVFMLLFYESITYGAAAIGTVKNAAQKYFYLLTATYTISVICYLTYFTSRLLIIPLGLGVLGIAYIQNKLHKRIVVLPAFILLIVYFVFPFVTFLNTPYAQGRFKETTVINSEAVKAATFEDISTAGLAGMPPIATRTLYNKITQNAEHFFLQYVSFFSPDTIFAQLDRPRRYMVIDTPPVTYIEYFGLLLGLGIIASVYYYRKNQNIYAGLLISIFSVLCAAIPTALTIDDFPNFQRGVIMTPFWQMAVAITIYFLVTQIKWFTIQSYKKQVTIALVGVLLLSSINFVPFIVRYFVMNPYYKPYYRSYPDYKLGEWINSQAHDEKIIVGDNDYTFIYPYLLAKENFLELPLTKTEGTKYFLKTRDFQIDTRLFVQSSDLCMNYLLQEKILSLDPSFIVLKYFENQTYDQCYIPDNYQLSDTISFADNQTAYHIFEKTASQSAEIKAALEASVSARRATQ